MWGTCCDVGDVARGCAKGCAADGPQRGSGCATQGLWGCCICLRSGTPRGARPLFAASFGSQRRPLSTKGSAFIGHIAKHSRRLFLAEGGRITCIFVFSLTGPGPPADVLWRPRGSWLRQPNDPPPPSTRSVHLDAPGQWHGQQPVFGTADPRSSQTGQVIRGLL